MNTDIDRLDQELDQEKVQAAVRRAEVRTLGEIVPVVVPRSANYEAATWRGAVGQGVDVGRGLAGILNLNIEVSLL